MKILYFPDTDTLSLQLPNRRHEGQDTRDPDVTIFYDLNNRIAEILIEHASERLDLDGLRAEPQFEEMRSRLPAPRRGVILSGHPRADPPK